MSKILIIDPEAKSVTQRKLRDNKEIGQILGGYIQLAYVWHDTGDVLYVDEEGMLKPQEHFFRFAPRRDELPIAGRGVITGRDLYDDEGEYKGFADVVIGTDAALELCEFLTRTQAEAWGKANASEPAVSITMFENGRANTTVLKTYGELFRNMPKETKP